MTNALFDGLICHTLDLSPEVSDGWKVSEVIISKNKDAYLQRIKTSIPEAKSLLNFIILCLTVPYDLDIGWMSVKTEFN